MFTPWTWGGKDWFQDCNSCGLDLQAVFSESDVWSWGNGGAAALTKLWGQEGLAAETEEVSSQQKSRRQHVQILHCSTARWSIRLLEMGAAEQEHCYEKVAAAASQFVKHFYKYSKCWLQQSEWFFSPLSVSYSTPQRFNYILGKKKEKEHMACDLAAWGSRKVGVGRCMLQNTL